MDAEAGSPLAIGLCNAGKTELKIWIEPWCDEIRLAAGGELALQIEAEDGVNWEPQIETTDEGLTIWGEGSTRIRFLIDGVEQDTGSAVLTAPDFGGMGTRGFVDTVFGAFPELRPGGRPAPRKRGWLRRLFGNE